MDTIFVAVTHTARSKARTGIQTVVRGLLEGLTHRAVDFQAVRWSSWRNALLPWAQQSNELWRADDKPGRLTNQRLTGSWLILPEVMYGSAQLRVLRHARKQKMLIAAIFHDAIPVSHPELVRRQAAKNHAAYMKTLSEVDLLIATSNTAAEQFRSFIKKNGLPLPRIETCRLAGEPIGRDVVEAEDRRLPQSGNILCVSTLEPRKNHETLLKAFDLASAAVSEPILRLHLVGDRHKDADAVFKNVKAAVARNPNIIWHGQMDADALSQKYRECDFSVFPSFLEGFGLPILESLSHGRPCICANFGAMAETAEGGGCLTVDVRDPIKLGEAIASLATSRELRQNLTAEIKRRKIKTWEEYAGEICRMVAVA